MEDRSTKSVQKPVMHNSIFAFTPYNHYDSNSSKESDGKDRDINAKKSRLYKTWKITGRIMKSHLRNCRKIVRNQKA